MDASSFFNEWYKEKILHLQNKTLQKNSLFYDKNGHGFRDSSVLGPYIHGLADSLFTNQKSNNLPLDVFVKEAVNLFFETNETFFIKKSIAGIVSFLDDYDNIGDILNLMGGSLVFSFESLSSRYVCVCV